MTNSVIWEFQLNFASFSSHNRVNLSTVTFSKFLKVVANYRRFTIVFWSNKNNLYFSVRSTVLSEHIEAFRKIYVKVKYKHLNRKSRLFNKFFFTTAAKRYEDEIRFIFRLLFNNVKS